MQVASSNLIVIDERPGTKNEVQRGFTINRPILIKNRSNQPADIDIWIDAIDNKSESLLRWCSFSEQNPLTLNANEIKEVFLKFQIPPSAIPDSYNYEIRVEAAEQYPGKIFRRPQNLKILPSDRDTLVGSNEPLFSIHPATTSTNPLSLKAGERVEIKVRVENRSRRVDRFYLCPELTPEFTSEWYTVKYPESDLDIPGLVKETDGLELNPRSPGELTLILHPPQHTPAGNYCPTLRLLSSNKEELVLLDIIYLHIHPDDKLDVRMHPPERKIPQEPGQFQIDLNNLGNIKRKLRITAKDEDENFSYSLQPSVVDILPGEVRTVALKTKPRKWWNRPWKGKALAIPFFIQLENVDYSTSSALLPQNLPQGKLIWQPRDWRLLWLLILLGLLSIGGIAFAIWWNFLKGKIPPPSPQIEKLTAVLELDNSEDKQQNSQQNITLNWAISNLSEIEKVTVIQNFENQETLRKNYIFKGKIPSELTDKCQKVSLEINSDSSQKLSKNDLNCTSVNTTAKQPGNYTFNVKVFSKQSPEKATLSRITDTVKIQPATPLPLPTIDEFSSTKPAYIEKNPDLPKNNSNETATSPIAFNWEISHPSNVDKFEIIGLAPDGSINSKPQIFELNAENDLPPELDNLCEWKKKGKPEEKLICQNLIIEDTEKAGDYIFKITLIPQGGKPENAIIKQTPLIKVEPLDTPQILTFSTASTTYRETTSSKNKAKSSTLPPIRLNWQITNSSQLRELQIIGTKDGSLSEYQRYPIINGKPNGLGSNCKKLRYQPVLNCTMVKTKAIEPGNYTFKIVALPKQENSAEIIKTTETITIQPQPATPVKIESFKINGQEASSNPKHTFTVNKQRTDANIAISWKVKKGEDIKVELLPAPGIVNTQGFIDNYPLSKPPSNETITLRVTNKAGEQTMQSVFIQTVEPEFSNRNESTGNGNSNYGVNTPVFQRSISAEDIETPENSERLSPIEFPLIAD